MATNPYEVLGVEQKASDDDIKTAYRKLARKFHPDLNPGNSQSETKFKEINSANEVIGDVDRRAKFDRGEIDATGAEIPPQGYAHSQRDPSYRDSFYHETQRNGGRYSSAFAGFGGDIFEEIYRRQAGGAGVQVTPDQRYRLEIDFRLAALGGETELTLPTGKSVKVRIPPGVESGKTLRLKGLVSAGDDAVGGDVYIELLVQPSKLFTRIGKNIEIEIPITIYEAILGGEIKIPTLERPIVLKVPPNSNNGSKLKAKGKGIAALKGSDRGDLIVRLTIVMPLTSDDDLQAAATKLRAAHPYNPRAQLDGGAL